MFKLAGLLIFLVIFFISYKLDNNKPPAKYHIPEGKKNGGKVPQGTGTVPAEKEKAAGGFDRQDRVSPGAEMTAEVQRYLADLVTFTPSQRKAADTNGDGNVTINDATRIQMYAAELIDHLG